VVKVELTDWIDFGGESTSACLAEGGLTEKREHICLRQIFQNQILSQIVTMRNSFLLVSLLFIVISADEHNHKYKQDDQVVCWVDSVGPMENRQETYSYSQLPYCSAPESNLKLDHHHETLGYKCDHI
jgi:hypothetical protein